MRYRPGLRVESVEIRSVLTCESKKGVCRKCYGPNLATRKNVLDYVQESVLDD